MLTNYFIKKLKTAKYKKLSDGTYYGILVGIPGIWANAKTLNACKSELREVFEEWVVF